MEKKRPLVVDLDGSLIASDILMEQSFQILKRNPLYFFPLVFWLFKGFAVLKKEVFKRSNLNPASLPYREEVLDYIKAEKSSDRKLILATASFSENALPIAEHLNLFDTVLATTPDFNLRGKNKAKVLLERYGEKGFDYVGDSYVDLSVWEISQKAILVEPSKDLISRTRKIAEIEKIFYPKEKKYITFFKAIRIKQWLKNILIFVPLLLSHTFSIEQLTVLIFGFFAFSFIASSVYLFNDLNDLESDRAHPLKKYRPIASGSIHLPNAFYLAIFLFLLGVVLSIIIDNSYFTYLLITYFISNFVYSKYLKEVAIVDIIVLSSFYTLRLLAGRILAVVEQSPWLVSFSIFVFLSFALLKRYAELKLLDSKGIIVKSVRGYRTTDEPLLLFSGLSLGFISTLIFLLYTQSEKVKLLYSHPSYLVYIAPLLILFIMRIWFNTSRVTETDNPFEIVIKDKLNFFVLILIVIIVIGAI